MLTINVQRFEDVIEEMIPLWEAHWKEIAVDQSKIPLEVDILKYLRLQREGQLLTVVAREAGKLVGYCIMFVAPHPHYRSTLFAGNDVLYLIPEARKGTNALKLIKFTEDFLKDSGVEKITWHIKPHKNFGAILEHRGYELFEFIYGKYIGD